jgi:arsenical pump membrane protein
MREALALVVLGATLAAAIARPRRAPDWLVAAGGALLLILTGVVPLRGARDAFDAIGPTVGFLAALLVLADGCRRTGLFAAAGALMADRSAAGSPRRLLLLVFALAAGTTAVLSLDATVVLLTPVVLATAARLRAPVRPHAYACAHLANSASLLLPVSNLTNLLAFRASGLSFAHFAAFMALPWLVAIAIEWGVISRVFRRDLARPPGEGRTSAGAEEAPARLPRLPVAVLAATLAGFVASSPLDVDPAWVAAAGAAVLCLAARPWPAPSALVRSADPGLLVFVLGLAVVVEGARVHGLGALAADLAPGGDGLGALLAIAALGALAANVLNNLPATLLLVPVLAPGGAVPVLALLIGVNAGPNLTYTGSLATLLWRRVLHRHGAETNLAEFTRLGLLTTPATLVAATVALWLVAGLP